MGEESPKEHLPAAISKTEHYQGFRPDRATSQSDIEAAAWHIATDPAFYKQVAANPYTEYSLHLLTERFPGIASPDAVKAVILAEPESTYDRQFHGLPRDEQRREFYRQIDTSAEMTMRVSSYVMDHLQEFWEMPQDEIFTTLTSTAFGESDQEKTHHVFSQKQRRGMKLAVANFIQDIQTLTPYREALLAEPKERAEEILGKEITGALEVETLPIGFVFHLEEADYVKFAGWDTNGQVIVWESLPPELRQRIVLINKGDESRTIPPESQQDTREHELRHVLYHSFAVDRAPLYKKEYEEQLEKIHTVKEYTKHAVFNRTLYTEHARNEIIAYKQNGNGFIGIDQYKGENLFRDLKDRKKHIQADTQLSRDEKRQVYKEYCKENVLGLQQIIEYQWIAQKLYQKSEQDPALLPPEKVEALLQNTTIDKIPRLAQYLGLTHHEIALQYNRELLEQVKRFTSLIDALSAQSRVDPDNNPSIWREGLTEENTQILYHYPKEVFPALQQILRECESVSVLAESISAIEVITFFHLTTLSPDELGSVKESLRQISATKTDDYYTYAREKAEAALAVIGDLTNATFTENTSGLLPK